MCRVLWFSSFVKKMCINIVQNFEECVHIWVCVCVYICIQIIIIIIGSSRSIISIIINRIEIDYSMSQTRAFKKKLKLINVCLQIRNLQKSLNSIFLTLIEIDI